MNRLAMMVLRNFWRVPGAYAKLCRYAKDPDKYPETETYGHIQYMLRCAIDAGNVQVQVFGRENIPQQGGFFMCGNHQGLFDVVALVANCDMPLGCVFKQELKNVPLLREIVACSRSYALDRENARQALGVLQNVTEQLQKGRSYLVFPEGTRSKNGNVMGEFHGGSFKPALKAKCPICPIVFVDSFRVLDQKGCAPVSMQIHFLPPIACEEYAGLKAVEVAALVKGRIQTVLDEYAK